MPINNVLASVAVRDLDAALEWYEKIFGKPDARPTPELAEWQFSGGGGLQVYQLPERAGHGSFTVAVSNIQQQIARIDALGIDTGERPSNARVKTLMISDPDGNHIAFAESLEPGVAQ